VSPLVDEAITTISIICPGLLMLFYRAVLPLSRPTLTYLSGVLRRHRRAIGSCWRKLNPGQQALLVLALLLPKTSSMLMGADAWVRPMLCAMAAGGALARQEKPVAL
jgi:hypothetical protein